jgi:hypothetical protein
MPNAAGIGEPTGLSSIQEFANDETQRRLWTDTTSTDPRFSFIEYLCPLSTHSCR